MKLQKKERFVMFTPRYIFYNSKRSFFMAAAFQKSWHRRRHIKKAMSKDIEDCSVKEYGMAVNSRVRDGRNCPVKYL